MTGWAYELVDAVTLAHVGWLECVTGGSLTWAYRGDYRVSGTLELDGGDVALGRAVRVWRTGAGPDGSETSREPVATLFPEPADMELALGRMSGAVEMHSAMKRLGTDLRSGDLVFRKGSSIVSTFSTIVRNSGGAPWVQPGFGTGRTFGSNRLWEHGKSVLSACHDCADALGAWVDVDARGRVTLTPYTAPARRPDTFSLTARDVQVGVGMASPDVVNKVVAHHEADKRLYRAQATVADSHPWAFARIGRWETAEVPAPALAEGADIQGELDALVRRELSELSDVRRSFSVTALAGPDVRAGAVGRLSYADAEDGEELSARVLVAEMEMALDHTGLAELTLEEV